MPLIKHFNIVPRNNSGKFLQLLHHTSFLNITDLIHPLPSSSSQFSESGVFTGDKIYMRGSASRSLAKTIEKHFYPIEGSWGGIVPSLEPKKNGNEDSGKARKTIADEKAADPIVAFSRPPPLPPIFGPLVALTMLDSWSKQDSNGNG
ncbi:uncharacterized protein LOC110719563 [Chenopodium quinoa]|uniref:uncharacterized protein LOC110719563 n=1 Tax=Chenopodium quinoa TaxID=63459 RepID=UPI000B7988B4|nr:uncharacterized protein LOC110719563 [Chenopodium quinoa]